MTKPNREYFTNLLAFTANQIRIRHLFDAQDRGRRSTEYFFWVRTVRITVWAFVRLYYRGRIKPGRSEYPENAKHFRVSWPLRLRLALGSHRPPPTPTKPGSKAVRQQGNNLTACQDRHTISSRDSHQANPHTTKFTRRRIHSRPDFDDNTLSSVSRPNDKPSRCRYV